MIITQITAGAVHALRQNKSAMALMVLRFNVHPRTLQNWTTFPFNDMLAHPDAVRIIRESCNLKEDKILMSYDVNPATYHNKQTTNI